MSATWTNEQLNDYIDDRLNAHQRAELESAMKEDPSARQALDELKKIRSLVRKAPRFKPRKSLAPVVVQAIGSQASQDRSDRAAPQPVLSQRETTSANFGNFDFRAAVAAIAALAACLLFVVLFAPSTLQKDDSIAEASLPPEPITNPSVSEGPNSDSAIRSGMANQNAGETATGNDEKPVESPAIAASGMPISPSNGAGDNVVVAKEDSTARPDNESATPESPDVQLPKTSIADSGLSSRFDEIILVRTSRTDIDKAFSQLALQPISRAAPPDSIHSPGAAIIARKQEALEDKSPQAENKQDSESTDPVPETPDVSSDQSVSAIMSHYVSVDATQSELDELLEQVNAQVDRMPLVQDMPEDAKAVTTGDEKASVEPGPADGTFLARELSPGESDQLPRMPGRKRFLLIFLESISPTAPGSDSR